MTPKPDPPRYELRGRKLFVIHRGRETEVGGRKDSGFYKAKLKLATIIDSRTERQKEEKG